eukprot:CAMPEP_0174298150 /NCGR_PEP_ID=MMETSP0809-20121228/52934_1 /TAXON_ID=73025 ORGANISM="Eutreptiella gymnastica-like, Strain CCMP1594" /NCGR_SAMPLE_ID=MMETSP0809 /ASSEMBLY_ACC=CAM_ASM_000658 /LENGTH=65 /DNA_ID=CAMNT_0015402401 /DNA_START=70 /DNA_END=264 /DNA_ORIENTATION=+
MDHSPRKRSTCFGAQQQTKRGGAADWPKWLEVAQICGNGQILLQTGEIQHPQAQTWTPPSVRTPA